MSNIHPLMLANVPYVYMYVVKKDSNIFYMLPKNVIECPLKYRRIILCTKEKTCKLAAFSMSALLRGIWWNPLLRPITAKYLFFANRAKTSLIWEMGYWLGMVTEFSLLNQSPFRISFFLMSQVVWNDPDRRIMWRSWKSNSLTTLWFVF